VTGFAEAEACFRDGRLSRQEAAARQFRWIGREGDPPEVVRVVDSWLSTILNLDPPDHTRLRRLVSRAFTSRAVAEWKMRTEEIVDDLLANLRRKKGFDLLRDFAYPLPETVICELLGVPAQDHSKWKAWTGGMGQAAIFLGRNRAEDELPHEMRAGAQQSLLKWYEYFQALVERRRGTIGGSDLLSRLVDAQDGADRLSENELIGALTLLVQAGHETTANLIGNGMLAMMRSPEQYALLRREPARAAGAVEEILRYDGPARGLPRVAIEDLVVGAKRIRKGEQILVLINAANRDPERFSDPDRFDIQREDTGHLAFASGIHFCVGAALARMEAEVAFRKIGDLDVVLELASEDLSYKRSHGRNLTRLPVVVRQQG
jgi:cytochrome P450